MSDRSDIADPRARAARFRDEAIELIEKAGLCSALERRFGRPVIVGSVDFDLMTWRDIDIYAPVEPGEKTAFLEIFTGIAVDLGANGYRLVRATFNDEWVHPRGNYGSGYYWGLRVRTAEDETWKADLWGWDSATLQAKLSEHESLKQRLRACDRDLILRLKNEVMTLAGFRRSVTSRDVYDAVLENEGMSAEQLLEQLVRKANSLSYR